MEEATFLTKFARSVTLVHRRDELRASRIMAERARTDDKIRFAWNSEVAAIHGDAKLTGVTLRNTATGETRELPVTGLFVAIGHDPRNEHVKDVVELADEGYVLVQGRTSLTNVQPARAGRAERRVSDQRPNVQDLRASTRADACCVGRARPAPGVRPPGPGVAGRWS